jgi:hypothetical protein
MAAQESHDTNVKKNENKMQAQEVPKGAFWLLLNQGFYFFWLFKGILHSKNRAIVIEQSDIHIKVDREDFQSRDHRKPLSQSHSFHHHPQHHPWSLSSPCRDRRQSTKSRVLSTVHSEPKEVQTQDE